MYICTYILGALGLGRVHAFYLDQYANTLGGRVAHRAQVCACVHLHVQTSEAVD